MWQFASSSGSKTYETLKYNDGSTSCDCMGWTRRCVDGQRTCKHVRMVEAGVTGIALSNAPVGAGHVVQAQVATTTRPKLKQSTFARKFV
jgi:hypothetical protein